MYINAHTYFSMRYGVMSPDAFLGEAQKSGVDCMALTDINSTSACIQFVRDAHKYNIRPVLGIDFRNGVDQQFIGLARNNNGYYELNRFLSEHLHHAKDFPAAPPLFSDVFVVYPFEKFDKSSLKENEYLGVRPSDLNRLRFSEWMKYPDKLLAMQAATFRNKRDFNAHRLLRAIDNNTLLSKLPKSEEASPDNLFLPVDKLKELYKDFPFLIHNSRSLLSQCTIGFEYGSENIDVNRQHYTGSAREDYQMVHKLCMEGLKERYPTPTPEIMKRIEMELKIISEKGFLSYFLINWDIVQYARSKNYFYVGRGSGANSIVAYLLRITNVDPIDLDLYFERFINLYRKNPPDFDLDFSWKDRDDVIEYIFRRFDNVALLATYNTFKFKAVARELGKVFGLPPHEIDLLSSGDYKFEKLDELNRLVVTYGQQINGFPSHLSIHAGGIVMPEKPLHYYTATFMPPKGFATTQFDMHIAEDIGLAKFDILSQRGLGKIKDALEIIRQNRPDAPPIDIDNIAILKQDKKINELIKTARAIGCFYVESPGMRMLLTKLEVDNYLGLVAASSIIRPGVASSGMMREYILRYRHPERLKNAHPILLNIMPETYGVMVYQEDVIKVAYHFADLTLNESDVLRRGMSGKFRSREEFRKVRDRFFENCRKKGHSDKITREVWHQIESFAGYAFAKGHSASYAVESYQSLYLKAYYPLEFMTAVINNFGGFYRTEFYVHEARMWGARVHPPDINKSKLMTVIYGKDIFLGFALLNGFESKLAERIVQERERNGLYQDLHDFTERLAIGVEQLSILIRIDAFRFSGIYKRELLWQAHTGSQAAGNDMEQLKLFSLRPKTFRIPPLSRSHYEDAFDQVELLGFSLYSPFMLIREQPENHLQAADLKKYLGKTIRIWGYLVTRKTALTIKQEKMYFGTFLDREGHFFDTTHFPNMAAQYPFRGSGVYAITGVVTEEFGFYSIEVTKMYKEALIEDPRYNDKEIPEHKQKADEVYFRQMEYPEE